MLIVEDNPELRGSLTVIFTRLRLSVEAAEDGSAALLAIGQRSPDILVSDLHVWFELLPIVRSRYPSIMVLAMSGAFPEQTLPAGIQADAFYDKGTGLDQLLGFLRDIRLLPDTKDCPWCFSEIPAQVTPVDSVRETFR